MRIGERLRAEAAWRTAGLRLGQIPPYQRNPDWYRIKYNLAVQYRVRADRIADRTEKRAAKPAAEPTADAGKRSPSGSEANRAEANRDEANRDEANRQGAPEPSPHDKALKLATQHATELILTAALTRRWLYLPHWQMSRPARRQMRVFLECTIEPAGAVALAGILLAMKKDLDHLSPLNRKASLQGRGRLIQTLSSERHPADTRPARLIEYAQRKDHLTYRVHYNLACYLSTTAGKLNGNEEHAEQIVAWAAPQAPGPAGVPPPRSAHDHVEGLLDDALEQLKRAIRRAPRGKREELATWAQSDPTLCALREGREADFKRLTREWVIEVVHVGRSRPRLKPLLAAQEQMAWSIDVVQELWAHALRVAQNTGLDTETDWIELFAQLQCAEP